MTDIEIIKNYGDRKLMKSDYEELKLIMNLDYYKNKLKEYMNSEESIHEVKGMIELQIEILEYERDNE